MAYAMMGGIIVGTALTLLFLPALYVAWFRIKEPSPEAEPVVDQQPDGKARPASIRSVKEGVAPVIPASGIGS